jgi:hypothetical protein
VSVICAGQRAELNVLLKSLEGFGTPFSNGYFLSGSLECVIKSSESFGSSTGNGYPSRDSTNARSLAPS